MQRKWMLLLSAIAILSLVIAPAGTVQAQEDTQSPSSNCPPYAPDRLRNKEFLYSLPQDCLHNYREMRYQATSAARDAGPAGNSFPTSFQYAYEVVPISWISGTINSGLTGDDAFTGPINIGFNFPFFGVPQSKLYISTNGLITFDAGSRAYWSDPIPSGVNPNNFIAAFWDDLLVGAPYNSGAIYYAQGGSAPNRYFVVEWRNVENYMGEGAFSFEAILYENGDIRLQYQSVPSDYDATMGIEGLYGEQGVELDYDLSGIWPGLAVRFPYPTTPAARVSMHLLQSGKFASPGKPVDFEILVTNTGTMGTDSYALLGSSDSWPAAYYTADGSTPLTDNDGDTWVDTGPVPAGSTVKIIARYTAPAQASAGNGNLAQIAFMSSLDPNVSVTSFLEMSIPSGFATAFQDEFDGAMSFLMASSEGATVRKVTTEGDYWRYEPAVARFPNGNYLYVWEAAYGDFTKFWTNIEYVILRPNGTIVLPITTLIDNSTSPYDTDAYSPSIAIAPDGTVGVVWYRYLYNQATGQRNFDILFATLNALGIPTSGPTSITNNTAWGGPNDYNIPELWEPTIAATSDNRFVIGWTEGKSTVYGYQENVWYAVRDTAGASVRAPTALTTSSPWVINDLSWKPVLNSLSNGRVILLWAKNHSSVSALHYAIITSSGEILKSTAQLDFGLPGAAVAWTGYDAVQLPNEKIAVAWMGPTGPALAFLNPSSYNVQSGPHFVGDGAYGDGLSVTTNASSQIIMTWAADFYQLAYTLVSSDGTYITMPMVYYTTGEYINVNRAGQGSVPFSAVIGPVATFLDVGTDYWAWQFVERLVNAGVTAGCGNGQYCPAAPVTRDQMAVFLLKAKHGKSYRPPAVGTGTGFADVPPTHWAAAWIKQLAAEGITGGCGAGNYCPAAPVTRDQMAVFLLKAKYGKSYKPPALGGGSGFGDVPPDHWAAVWIKQLAAEGITGGCGTGTYCPGQPVNRAEMAVFLVRTFHLP